MKNHTNTNNHLNKCSYDNILVVENNRIISVEIKTANPSKNYISMGLIRDLDDIIQKINTSIIIEHENRYDILVIKGNRKAFSLGASIADYIEEDSEKIKDFIDVGNAVFDSLSNLPLITISAVQGYALGGGFELALSCDFILASDRAKFGLVESNIGLLPGWGGFYKLGRRAGFNKAFEYTLKGSIIDAETAYRSGIVNAVKENREFDTKLEEFCNDILSKGSDTISEIKGLYSFMNSSCRDRYKDYFNLEKESFSRLWNENSKQKIKDLIMGS